MSAKVVLYIASTLDGYIATSDGDLGWLTSYDGGSHGYDELMERSGALAMGSGTYEFFDHDDEWPYPDQTTWLFTRRQPEFFEGADIRVVEGSPSAAMDRMVESADGKDIWLVGGGVLIADFLREGLIDEIQHFIVPKALGSGIPMFTEPVLDAFEIEDVKKWSSGIVEVRYRPSGATNTA